MSESMHKTDEDVDAFLTTLRDAEAHIALDARIRRALPHASRTLWRGVYWGGTAQAIIGYGDLVQPRPRGTDVEWFLVGLAQQATHSSLYVNAIDGDRYLAPEYAAALGRVKVGSAAVSFRTVADLDPDGLDALLAHVARVTSAGS